MLTFVPIGLSDSFPAVSSSIFCLSCTESTNWFSYIFWVRLERSRYLWDQIFRGEPVQVLELKFKQFNCSQSVIFRRYSSVSFIIWQWFLGCWGSQLSFVVLNMYGLIVRKRWYLIRGSYTWLIRLVAAVIPAWSHGLVLGAGNWR